MLRAELYQSIHTRINWVYGLVSILLSLVLTFGEGSANSIDEIFKSSLYNVPITLLVSYLFCSIRFGQQFRKRLISRELVTGVGRSRVLLCKYLCFILFAAVFNIGPVIVNCLFGTMIFQYRGGIHGTGVRLLVLYILLSAAMCSIPFLIAFLVQEMGKNLILSLLFYFMSIYVLNGKYALALARFLPIGQMRLLLAHAVSEDQVAALCLLWILGPLAVAVLRFKNCELK